MLSLYSLVKGYRELSELKTLFGKRIAALRNEHKWTQAKLAEKVDMSPSAIAEIETGVTFPRPETLEKIKNAFGCEYCDLFNFNDTKMIDNSYKDIKQSVEYFHKHRKDVLPVLKLFIQLLKR